MGLNSQLVAVVIGASRGIGRQVAIDLAKNGYRVVVAAKSISDASNVSPFPPDPNSSQSTINTVQREIQEAALDSLQAAAPLFQNNGWHSRVIVVSPPIYSRFFRGKTAYAIGKIGMSVLTKGLAMDWKRQGKTNMAISSIWPATGIMSAATPDPIFLPDLRHPSIFSDAILEMLRASTETISGCLELDEDFLRQCGVRDFSTYSIIPGTSPRRIMPAQLPTLTVAEEEDEGLTITSTGTRQRSSKM